MSRVEYLKRLVTPDLAGPVPAFTLTHVVRALQIIGERSGIGRKRLSELLGIGEGSVRTLLQRLQDARLVQTTREGCRLTGEGERLHRLLRERISPPTETKLRGVWEYPYTLAVVVRRRAEAIRRGIEQRDAAIREGADAAMTLIYRGGELLMPGVSNVSREHPRFAAELTERLSPGEGDVIILVGAKRRDRAERGAVAAALATMELME